MKPIDSKSNNPLNFNSIPLELRLLLSCLRAFAGRDEEHQINTLARMAIDWDVFISLVDRHRTPSQAYRSLNRFAANNIPEPVLNRLRERFHGNAQRVLAKTAELVRIAKLFEQKGILFLPLKGPVLALQLYGHLGSRHVGDLDIMVPPKSVEMAEDVLLQQGYKRAHPDFHLTPKQHSIYLQNNHHFGYFCKARGVRVELHWRFGSNRSLFPLRFNDLWKDKQTIRIGGSEMATLSLEHTILFLCTHGAGHAWFRLFWLNDIAYLMKKHDTMNWQSLMLHASRLGIGRMAAEGIILSNLLLAGPLPEPILAFSEKDKGVYKLAGMAFSLMKHPGGLSHKPFTKPYYFSKMHKAMLRGDLRYKLIFSANLISAKDDDWNRIPLPDLLFPFYHLVRPVTWFSRWYVRSSKVYKEGPMGRGKNGAI